MGDQLLEPNQYHSSQVAALGSTSEGLRGGHQEMDDSQALGIVDGAGFFVGVVVLLLRDGGGGGVAGGVIVGAEVVLLRGGAVAHDGVDEVVEVVVGAGEGVPVDDGGPMVPVATIVIIRRGDCVGDCAVTGEVHVHVYFHGGW